MSVEVIKAGIASSVQDGGRFGYQHLGINPNGAMDLYAMKLGNALVGNELNEAVLEMSFPSPVLQFKQPALIALTGADFQPRLNRQKIPLHQLVLVSSGSELSFARVTSGAWCYLAVSGGFDLPEWLGSRSTNLKAQAGGFNGRYLMKGDVLPFRKTINHIADSTVLPWRAQVTDTNHPGKQAVSHVIRCLPGHEYEWLTKLSQKDFMKSTFRLDKHSDRMGYHLSGPVLKQKVRQELLSTAVGFGTLQLLPSGQLIALMADHQTTGGYPRVAHVIAADRSALAQCRPNQSIQFTFVQQQEAEDLLVKKEQQIRQLQYACRYRLQDVGL